MTLLFAQDGLACFIGVDVAPLAHDAPKLFVDWRELLGGAVEYRAQRATRDGIPGAIERPLAAIKGDAVIAAADSNVRMYPGAIVPAINDRRWSLGRDYVGPVLGSERLQDVLLNDEVFGNVLHALNHLLGYQ